ncbi:MAG: hypothetical protein AAF434_17240 [Pseudomonadota bacterium]
MAAGDYLIRRNAANTDAVPNAGSDLLCLYDTAVANNGSGITYSAGTITLGETGRFLVMCSEQYGTTDTTNNQRVSAKLTLTLGGTELQEGFSSGYIRKSGGSQEFINFSAAIIDVTSTVGTADELQCRLERVDSSTAGTVNRIADRSGFTVLKLDDSWNYGRYESSAAFTPTATANNHVASNLGTTLEEDSVFTRTGNTVALNTNNLVLAVYSLKNDPTDTVSGRSEYQGALSLNGTQIDGTWSQTYGPRGSQNTNIGGMSCVALLNPTSGDDLELDLISRADADEDWLASLQLVELPSGAEAVILSGSGGNMNANGADYAYTSADYIDTAAFTYTGGNANVDVDNGGDYLVMASQAITANSGSSGTRAVPAIQFRVNSTDNEVAGNSSYNRVSGSADHAGMAAATLLSGLSANDSVYTRNDRIGTNGTTIAPGSAGMSLVRLDSIFSSGENNDATLSTASITVSGNAPQGVSTENVEAQLSTASITLTANALTATATENVTALLDTATVSITGNALTGVNSEGDSANLPSASITLQGNDLQGVSTENNVSTLNLAGINLTANALQGVTTENHVALLDTASITFTGLPLTGENTGEQVVTPPPGGGGGKKKKKKKKTIWRESDWLEVAERFKAVEIEIPEEELEAVRPYLIKPAKILPAEKKPIPKKKRALALLLIA